MVSRKGFAAGAAALFGTAPLCARAADAVVWPVQFKPAAPGSTFQFQDKASNLKGGRSDEKVEVVVKNVALPTVTYTRRGDLYTTYLVVPFDPDSINTSDRAGMSSLWPLQFARKLTVHRHAASGWGYSSTEQITVAGTADERIGDAILACAVVEARTETNSMMQSGGGIATFAPLKALSVTWYAPEIGWIVRETYQNNRGISFERRLLSYKLAE